MVSFLVFSILFKLPLAMLIGNSPSTCLWALSAKSKLGQIPWKGQYVYGIFSVSWYKFWLGRKEKGKRNRPGLTYVLMYKCISTTNVNSWKVKTLDSSHFFLKGPCDVGNEYIVDRSNDWSDLTENKIPVEICPISECELDLNKLTYLPADSFRSFLLVLGVVTHSIEIAEWGLRLSVLVIGWMRGTVLKGMCWLE